MGYMKITSQPAAPLPPPLCYVIVTKQPVHFSDGRLRPYLDSWIRSANICLQVL